MQRLSNAYKKLEQENATIVERFTSLDNHFKQALVNNENID